MVEQDLSNIEKLILRVVVELLLTLTVYQIHVFDQVIARETAFFGVEEVTENEIASVLFFLAVEDRFAEREI